VAKLENAQSNIVFDEHLVGCFLTQRNYYQEQQA
jgi:hypothetical protein